MKFKSYHFDKPLLDAIVSIKIDGVRGHFNGKLWSSRANKPLHNLPIDVEPGIYEIFLGSFKQTISAVKTHNGDLIDKSNLYMLQPNLSNELYINTFPYLTPGNIKLLLKDILFAGYEGLVILSQGVYYKVKKEETHDVKILGILPGTGKNKGKLGALVTAYGKVGTGFTDQERVEYNSSDLIGQVVEVRAMELTAEGRFRHPVFIRLRPDKVL